MSAVPFSYQFNISRFFQAPVNVALARLAPLPLFRLYGYIIGLSYLAVRADQRQLVASGVLAPFQHKGGLTKRLSPLEDLPGDLRSLF